MLKELKKWGLQDILIACVAGLKGFPCVDFSTAVAVLRMATANSVTLAYLLAPEVSYLLFYMPDLCHYMLFSTIWNTGVRIGESRTLPTRESFDLDEMRPFVKVLSEKLWACCGRPPKVEERLVPLTDESYVHQLQSWMVTPSPTPGAFVDCHR